MTHKVDPEYFERSYFESLRRAQIASDQRLAAVYKDFAGKYAQAFREETGITLALLWQKLAGRLFEAAPAMRAMRRW